MRNILLLTLLLAFSAVTTAQVGVGTKTPDKSAALEVQSTTKGFLPPRMTYAQIKAINDPAEGLIIYCTDCTPKGIYVHGDTNFEHVPSGTTLTAPIPTVLEQIGKEADNPNVIASVVTIAQLKTIPGITDVDDTKEKKYQDYIDANPDKFSEPAILAEVQSMIDKLNIPTVLEQIGKEADNPNVIASVVTIAQLKTIPGITDVDDTKEKKYQDYIDANPDKFSEPAILAEVQSMIDALNAIPAGPTVLEQIGKEAEDRVLKSVVTIAQLKSIPGITGVDDTKQKVYQEYIDYRGALRALSEEGAPRNPFSNPATVEEVQSMIDYYNVMTPPPPAIPTVLEQIGAEANTAAPSIVTTVQLKTIPGITGVNNSKQADYRRYIDENSGKFSNPATVREVQAMINGFNIITPTPPTILEQIGTEANTAAPSIVTTAQLKTIPGITGVNNSKQADYRRYIDGNPNKFSNPARVREVQAMVDLLNLSPSDLVLAQIGKEANTAAPSIVTTAQLKTISGITGVDNSKQTEYQNYIDGNSSKFSNPARVREVQAMIDLFRSDLVLAQIGIEANTAAPSIVTTAQLKTIFGITGVDNSKQADYRRYIDGNSNKFSEPATVEEVQAMINELNSPLVADSIGFKYMPLVSTKTGKIWLNNNLGANYANPSSPSYNPRKHATAASDA
ncbi:MAG: hypothetical protein ACWIPJ_00855, partial [Polaribacter sp.]